MRLFKKSYKIQHGGEGHQRAKKEIALAFLEKGIDIQIISECTGLSIEEIENLEEMEEEIDE